MKKNVIFDFGQVLVRFDPDYMTGVYVKDPRQQQTVQEVGFDRLYWDPLDAGQITDEQIKDAIRSRLPAQLQEAACAAYDNWHKNLPFIPGMPELVAQLKARGVKLYLLSNISIGFAEKYSEVPQLRQLFDLFDGLVFSGPLGMVKPGKEIFDHALHTYGLKAEECVFVDDNPNNIAGAKAAGIDAWLFDGDAQRLQEMLLA